MVWTEAHLTKNTLAQFFLDINISINIGIISVISIIII